MSSMDGGSVDIRVDVDPGGVKAGMAEAKQDVKALQGELRGLDKQIRQIEEIRGRVPTDVFGRSFYAKDLAALKAQRAELAGIVEQERLATQAAQQRTRAMGGGSYPLGPIGRGGLRSLGVAGAVGIGGYLLGQNLQEFPEGSAASNAGGFLTNLVSGNVVGAIKAAGHEVQLTDDQVEQLGRSSRLSSSDLDAMTASLKALGTMSEEQRQKLAAVRAEINAGYALQAYQQSSIGAAGAPVMPNDRGGLQGVGAAEAVIPNPAAAFNPKGALNAFRQQQTAIAFTTPGKGDEIEQTRKNIAYLERLTKDVRIQGQARTSLYTEIGQQQQTLKALTTKPPAKEAPLLPPALEMQLAQAQTTINKTDDNLRALRRIDEYLTKAIEATKNINRKTELLNLQGQTREEIQSITQGTVSNVAVNPASVLGALGQGPFLTSPVAQFAESFGFKPRARDYLKDIRSQVAAGTKLDRQLGMLRKRGLSDAAIAELAGQGLGAADMVGALAKAPASLVRQYSQQAERREEVSASIQAMTADIQTANIVVRNGRVTGIDRNGNGTLEERERFGRTAAAR